MKKYPLLCPRCNGKTEWDSSGRIATCTHCNAQMDFGEQRREIRGGYNACVTTRYENRYDSPREYKSLPKKERKASLAASQAAALVTAQADTSWRLSNLLLTKCTFCQGE